MPNYVTPSEYLEYLESGKISPYALGEQYLMNMDGILDVDKSLSTFTYRHLAQTHHGHFATVDGVFCKALAEWIGGRSVLEVMAGVGWLAQGLRDNGVDIVATDDLSWARPITRTQPVTDVKRVEATKAAAHSDADILLMAWPPMSSEAIETAEAWGRDKLIVYIGEGYGGCTADYAFFENTECIADQPDFVRSYTTWPGLHDYPSVRTWKPKEIDE